MGRLDLLERVLPHVADQAELDTLRVYYPLQNYVLALYHSQAKNRYDDPAAIRRFWDLGIGVYSDEPFAPLDGAYPRGEGAELPQHRRHPTRAAAAHGRDQRAAGQTPLAAPRSSPQSDPLTRLEGAVVVADLQPPAVARRESTRP